MPVGCCRHAAWPLFAAMPVADRRHALDVVGRLIAAGHDDPDLLAAALLHDAAKGHRMRLWHRVAGVLLEAMAPRSWSGWRRRTRARGATRSTCTSITRTLSADAAGAAGCSARTVAPSFAGRRDGADASLAAAFVCADEAS